MFSNIIRESSGKWYSEKAVVFRGAFSDKDLYMEEERNIYDYFP